MHGDRRQGRKNASEYAEACIDMRTAHVLISACVEVWGRGVGTQIDQLCLASGRVCMHAPDAAAQRRIRRCGRGVDGRVS